MDTTALRRTILMGVLAIAAAIMSACQLPVNATGYVGGSGPGGSTLTGHTITNSDTDPWVYALSGSGDTVHAYAAPQVDGNEREALWFTNSSVAQDEEACATWNDLPGLTQDGILLHMGQDANGVAHGIEVTDNIWLNTRHEVNIGYVTGDTNPADAQIALAQSYDVSAAFGGEVTPYIPLPWHMCARTIGNQAQFVVWTGTNSKPAYGTPGYSGSITINPAYTSPGIAGWWIGHMPAGSTHTITNMTSTDS